MCTRCTQNPSTQCSNEGIVGVLLPKVLVRHQDRSNHSQLCVHNVTMLPFNLKSMLRTLEFKEAWHSNVTAFCLLDYIIMSLISLNLESSIIPYLLMLVQLQTTKHTLMHFVSWETNIPIHSGDYNNPSIQQ